MFPQKLSSLGLAPILLLCATAAPAAPQVVKTSPPNGAGDVDPATSRITVTFDTPMKTEGYSILETGDAVLPEMVGDDPVRFEDDKTLSIRVKLSPATSYAMALNSAKRQGFKAADGTPLAPTIVRFRTRGGQAEAEETTSPLAELRKSKQQSGVSTPPNAPPALGEGWTLMDDQIHGTQVAVPRGWTPRIRGGVALCVDPDDVEKAGAFFIPVTLKGQTRPEELADNLDEMLRRGMPDLETKNTDRPSSDSVQRELRATIGDVSVAGTYRAAVSRSGMGFIMGYLGPADRLDQLRPTFHRVLASYRFTGPRLWLVPFKSAAVELRIPPGWQVQTSEANGTADQDIDWAVVSPRIPGARAFMVTPKYCTTNWVTDGFNANIDQTQVAMWRAKGYEIANLASDEQAIQAAINSVLPGFEATRKQSLDELRDLLVKVNAVAIQTLRQTGGRYDFYVLELHGRRNVQGVEMRSVVYVGASGMVTMAGMKGAMGLWSVQVRGYEAPADQFIRLATMLERVCTSFTYTDWWIREVQKANAEQAKQIREFWAYMNKVDREIWDNRMRTSSAINEMMYDSLIAGTPGFVNKNTGTIEKIPTDSIRGFTNDSGDVLSPEELLEKKVDPYWATRVRPANADDYMNYDRRVQVWP
jgi:hypothetical protein